jgi:hypothetical protein
MINCSILVLLNYILSVKYLIVLNDAIIVNDEFG